MRGMREWLLREWVKLVTRHGTEKDPTVRSWLRKEIVSISVKLFKKITPG